MRILFIAQETPQKLILYLLCNEIQAILNICDGSKLFNNLSIDVNWGLDLKKKKS